MYDIEMITKEGSTKIINFMTPVAGLHELERDNTSHIKITLFL